MSTLLGITMGDWLRLCRENRFAIEPRYWRRAARLTMMSIVTHTPFFNPAGVCTRRSSLARFCSIRQARNSGMPASSTATVPCARPFSSKKV